MHGKKLYSFILTLMIIDTLKCEQNENRGTYLAIDTSSEVSKLVSRAFRSVPKPIEKDNGVVSAVLKLMGLEGQKLGAIAVNSIVMISQLIANNLISTSKTVKETKRNGNNIISSIIESVLMKQEDHSELFNRATKENVLTDISADEDSTTNYLACTKLLLCKIQPFVKGMQKNVVNMMRLENKLIMNKQIFSDFPSIKFILKEFDNCDSNYSQCIYK